MPKVIITEEQKNAMRELRSLGHSWIYIGKKYGISDVKAHYLCDPEFLARCRSRDKNRTRARKGYGFRKDLCLGPEVVVHVPESVVKQREELLNAQYRSEGDRILGCPPIGRSALDRKMAERRV